MLCLIIMISHTDHSSCLLMRLALNMQTRVILSVKLLTLSLYLSHHSCFIEYMLYFWTIILTIIWDKSCLELEIIVHQYNWSFFITLMIQWLRSRLWNAWSRFRVSLLLVILLNDIQDQQNSNHHWFKHWIRVLKHHTSHQQQFSQ